MSLRLVMMGTGNFALPTFQSLYSLDAEVVGLFTQPDRTGRGHHRHRNVMKEEALEHDTPVFQPEKINTPESLDQLRQLNADLCVVAAYGQILSDELLSIPRLGAINVHASLLPKYRGAAPIQYAILKGEAETGVTIFQIEPKLDAGPILGVEKTLIGPKEKSGELEERLSQLSVPLVARVIEQIASETTKCLVQDITQVTRAPRLKKSAGTIDWTQSSDAIGWHIRAMQPWPKAFTHMQHNEEKPVRLLVLEIEPIDLDSCDEYENSQPGTIVLSNHKQLVVRCGNGFVELKQVQPEGKRAMTAAEFLNGHSIQAGDCLISAK